MPGPLVLWHGRRLAIVPAGSEQPTFVPVAGDARAAALQVTGDQPLTVAPSERAKLAALRDPPPLVESSVLREQLAALGVPSAVAERATARRAIERLGVPDDERAVALAVARAALARAQRDPQETLIALAREEERLERALGRETNAQDGLLEGWGEANPELAEEIVRFREAFVRHHDHVEREVERQVSRLAPTLAAVTGPKVAARLISAASGLSPLARMPAGRIQLLGVRRRPAGGFGPRHGLIYRARGMETIPYRRQGAYARSVAASAAIAARVDHAGLRRDQAQRLQSRLERRRKSLRGDA